MNRPENIEPYKELDLKLGIKSSLPHVKSTLGLSILLWECSSHPHELIYSVSNGDSICIPDELAQWVSDELSEICSEEQIDTDHLISTIESNQLYKSQIEALMVAFELIWKIAKVEFTDDTRIASAERTGGNRYPKKLKYTTNIDIIHSIIENDLQSYYRTLLSWIGINIPSDPECEHRLLLALNVLAENALFNLVDNDTNIIFNLNCIYKKLLETNEAVDISGDKESKGPLRILKSALSEGMNPYLSYSNGNVTLKTPNSELLEDYQKRAETYLQLSTTKLIDLKSLIKGDNGDDKNGNSRIIGGTNVILYGVPGSGKSWTIEHEYCSDESKIERLVFHPDYMYSDFIGQILPVIIDDKVRYQFVPGPFTKLLKKAYNDPQNMYYLIIEEINRGNAPAIFGEVFQLLDRVTDSNDKYPIGTSEYGITNANIAEEVYGDTEHKVRIPSNLSLIGTMNTSDQNVFTLDTAFQRRWIMRMIPNSFKNHSFAQKTILDTTVTWENFCHAINNEILRMSNVTSSEDKRLGAYFINESDLGPLIDESALADKPEEQIKAHHKNSIFAEKVLKYLWDDAFKFNHNDIFNSKKYKSLESLIDEFMSAKGNKRFNVFNDNLKKAIINGVNEEGDDVHDNDSN